MGTMNLRFGMVLALILGASTLAVVPAESSTEWEPIVIACGGLAPLTTSCKRTLKIPIGYKVASFNDYGIIPKEGESGIFVDSLFSGWIEAEWASPRVLRYGSAQFVGGKPVPMIWSSHWGSGWWGDRFGNGTQLTMSADVVGSGTWRIAVTLLPTEPRRPKYRWYTCRGHTPEDTTCTRTFRVGKNMTSLVGGGGCSRMLYCTTHSNGTFEVRWETRKQSWKMSCSMSGIPFRTQSVGCAGDHQPPLARGTKITMTVEASGVGGWVVSNQIQLR